MFLVEPPICLTLVFTQHGMEKWYLAFKSRQDSLGKLEVKVGKIADGVGLMEIDGKVIMVDREATLEEGNIEAFILGFMHEMVHGFSAQAPHINCRHCQIYCRIWNVCKSFPDI